MIEQVLTELFAALMLCNKYRRALDFQKTHIVLTQSMRELGVESREE